MGGRLHFPTTGMNFQDRHNTVGMSGKNKRSFRAKLLQGTAQCVGPVIISGDGFHNRLGIQMCRHNDHIRLGSPNFRHDLFQCIHRRYEADPIVQTEPDPVIIPVTKQTDHGDFQTFPFQHSPPVQSFGGSFGGINELNIGTKDLTGGKEITIATECFVADPEFMIARNKNIILECIQTLNHGRTGIDIRRGRSVGNIAAIDSNQILICRPFLIDDRTDLSDGCLSVNIRGVKDCQFLCGESNCSQTQQHGTNFFHHVLFSFLYICYFF